MHRRKTRPRPSLAAAARLETKSRNAHARYERGASVPTVAKLDALLRAISSDHDCMLHPSTVGEGIGPWGWREGKRNCSQHASPGLETPAPQLCAGQSHF